MVNHTMMIVPSALWEYLCQALCDPHSGTSSFQSRTRKIVYSRLLVLSGTSNNHRITRVSIFHTILISREVGMEIMVSLVKLGSNLILFFILIPVHVMSPWLKCDHDKRVTHRSSNCQIVSLIPWPTFSQSLWRTPLAISSEQKTISSTTLKETSIQAKSTMSVIQMTSSHFERLEVTRWSAFCSWRSWWRKGGTKYCLGRRRRAMEPSGIVNSKASGLSWMPAFRSGQLGTNLAGTTGRHLVNGLPSHTDLTSFSDFMPIDRDGLLKNQSKSRTTHWWDCLLRNRSKLTSWNNGLELDEVFFVALFWTPKVVSKCITPEWSILTALLLLCYLSCLGH